MNTFWFKVDVSEVAQRINAAKELVENAVVKGVESLSIGAHAFILDKARKELEGFKLNHFLGTGDQGKNTSRESTSGAGVDQSAKNVRWIKEANSLWVVEIDDKAEWIESGRERQFMDWLLKPGSKGLKTARDGSTYKVIPFTQMKGGKPQFNTGLLGEGPGGDIAKMISKTAKAQGISLKKIERDHQGIPKTGILHKLDIKSPDKATHGLFYSKPRTAEEAKATGLKPHGGIFHMAGAVVTQRETSKGKFRKDVVTFRVISSKHKAEGRFFYPEVKPFGSIPAAHKWAEAEWEKIVKSIEESFSKG